MNKILPLLIQTEDRANQAEELENRNNITDWFKDISVKVGQCIFDVSMKIYVDIEFKQQVIKTR